MALTVDVSCDALEKRTFDYFRARTAPCVSGYFQDTVWDRMILQASHTEPAIRHAINALGALHEENTLRRKATSNGQTDVAALKTSFAVKQYSKALLGLHQLLTSGDVPMNLVVMCSLVFIHFEAFRENFMPALVHCENAIRLLHSSTMFNAKAIDPSLVRAMMRIDVQGAMYLGMRVPGLPFYTAATDGTLPKTFHDLTQARDIVNTWTCRLFHFLRTEADEHKFREPGEIPLEKFAKASELEKIFQDLDDLLWEFMHKPNIKLVSREHHGLGMLRTRVKINRITAAVSLYSEATMYDAYMDDFEDILVICSAIETCDNADRRLFSVSLDEGMLQPLWFISTHCRDSIIRRQALKLLKRLPPKTGIWHVEAMTRMAEVCIDFEEGLTEKEYPKCTDIPEWRRIHSAGFDGMTLQSPKETVKAHMRVRPNGMDGEWATVEEIIEW